MNALLMPIWPYLMFAAAAVMAAAALRTHLRGWVKDEEGVVYHREDHPRSFLVTELLGIASVGILIYVGFGAMYGWE
jgi:hypothetical protein